jgi:hypothetical protein
MSRIATIRRAFISYSHENRGFVDTLASDLRQNGFEVWVDFEALEPGTPDWERELREAIDESFAFLLISSPHSRKSEIVRSELLVAQARRLPIFALWAAGESWIDSIPMSLAHIQYLDFRKSTYAKSLDILLKKLSALHISIPDHFLYESFYNKVIQGQSKPKASWEKYGSFSSSGSSFEIFTKKQPAGLMEIRLADVFRALQERDNLDTLFVNPNAFKAATHLLDEIYMNYLSERYPPFTYGTEWHLRRGDHPTQLGLDWRQLKKEFDPNLLMDETPATYRFTPGSTWEIADGMPPYIVALAANDKWLIDTILTQAKASNFLMANYMRISDAETFDRTFAEFVAVATEFFFDPPSGLQNKLLIQNQPCPDEIKKRWTY